MRPGCQGIKLNQNRQTSMHEVGMDALMTNPLVLPCFGDPWSIVKLIHDRVIVDIEMHPWLGGRERNRRILNIKRD